MIFSVEVYFLKFVAGFVVKQMEDVLNGKEIHVEKEGDKCYTMLSLTKSEFEKFMAIADQIADAGSVLVF